MVCHLITFCCITQDSGGTAGAAAQAPARRSLVSKRAAFCNSYTLFESVLRVTAGSRSAPFNPAWRAAAACQERRNTRPLSCRRLCGFPGRHPKLSDSCGQDSRKMGCSLRCRSRPQLGCP